MKSSFVAVCLFLCLGSVFGQSTRYERDEFYFDYPATWKVLEAQSMGNSIVLMRAATDTIFTDNISMVILDLSEVGDFTLSSYVEQFQSQLVAMYGESSMLESVLVNDDQPPYHKLIYTGQMGAAVLKFEQFVWFLDGSAYLFTFTTSEKRFDQQKAEVEQILGSLKFKD